MFIKPIAMILTALSVLVTPVTVRADAPPTTPAWFEDHWIDLAVDWEGAAACDVQSAAITCFASETEFDHATAQPSRRLASVSALASSLCSSALKLYDGTSYTGTLLSLSTRSTVLNLSAYGFDNVTSSYKVGACNVDMYGGAAATGGLYPGNTSAGAQASSMVTGWSNTISSVLIA